MSSFNTFIFRLSSLVVHVACQTSEGSFQLIELLMNAADKKDTTGSFSKLDKAAKKVCSKIMVKLIEI